MQTFIAFQRRDEKIPREIPKLREDYCKPGRGDVPHTLSPTEVSFREDLGATEGSG